MAERGRGPSRQELIRRRRSSAFVGRRDELATFDAALHQRPEDAEQFLFHIRGQAGVGKSTLVRQLEQAARAAGAVTAYVDESAADVLETMQAVSARFAQQGLPLKEFDKRLATYRRRRHEAEAQAAAEAGGDEDAPAPSPVTVLGTQVGMVVANCVPGVPALTAGVDARQVAAGIDHLRRVLTARLRSPEDVELVLFPVEELTPLFLAELAQAAHRRPWAVLLLDTYERTGPLLDVWLRDLVVRGHYGDLPGNVLVVLAGQGGLDPRCWGDWTDLVTDLPLEVFTDAEARRLLAHKGVTDPRAVDVVLELSGRLPVLVSTLADARPAGPAEVGDPTGTAVERFLRWETDPVRRAAALACALPRELDEDVYRAAVQDEAAEELFPWLRTKPFVIHRAGRCRYHDVVRTAMLRLQRRQSPARWRERHTRLADAFRDWRARLEEGAPPPRTWWADEQWRAHRLDETYHRLCADPRGALPEALRDVPRAYEKHDLTALRHWARTLLHAGTDADAPDVRDWGGRFLAALDEPRPGVAVLTLALGSGALDTEDRWRAHGLRARAHRRAGAHEAALADYDRAVALDPRNAWSLTGRGDTQRFLGRYEAALADYDRAIALAPDNPSPLASRGEAHRLARRYEEALADLTRAVELRPDYTWALGGRGDTHRLLGRYREALADFDRALETDPDYLFALEGRGDTHRALGRYEEALADLDRAVELRPGHTGALAQRAATHRALGRYREAADDVDRVLGAQPGNAWAHCEKGLALTAAGRPDGEEHLRRAVALLAAPGRGPADWGTLALAATALGLDGEAERALTAFLAESPPPRRLDDLDSALAALPRPTPATRTLAARHRTRLTEARGDAP